MNPRLLLVADDEEDNRIIFSAILMHHRYNVSLATNGKEAVEQATRHAPDLILMDLQMPILDGWEATRLLKADPDTASIPIVAVTAQDQTNERLQEGGFCGYVRKPIAPKDLIRVVELCLEGIAREELWVDLSFVRSPAPPVQ